MANLKKLLFEQTEESYKDVKMLKPYEFLDCPFDCVCLQRFHALYEVIEAAGLEDEFQEWIDNKPTNQTEFFNEGSDSMIEK